MPDNPPAPAGALTVSTHEAEQVARANAARAQPVVFVHGLWLLASSASSEPPQPCLSGPARSGWMRMRTRSSRSIRAR